LPPCRAAPLWCSATTLGACFIEPNQKGETNPDRALAPRLFVRRKRAIEQSSDSAQARATDRVFSRHLLARACKAPRLYRSPLMCEHPSNPTSKLSHQLPFLPRRSALPNPCSRRANLTFCICLLAHGWQSTSMVSILNKRSCCWVLQLRPRSDLGRLVHPRSKPLGGPRAVSDRARRVLHL
jgi:hypothetical protein